MINHRSIIGIAVLCCLMLSSCDHCDSSGESKTAVNMDTTSKPLKNEEVALPKPEVAYVDSISIGRMIFESNCTSCHKVGGVLIGPNLAEISKKKSHKWQLAFIRHPERFFKTDPYIKESIKNSNGALMTGFPDMTDSAGNMLLKFIDNMDRGVAEIRAVP